MPEYTVQTAGGSLRLPLQLSLTEQKLGIGLAVPMGFAAACLANRLQLVPVKDFFPKLDV
jgi:hypothetical protein